MENLLSETVKTLSEHGYGLGDIYWIGNGEYEINVQDFIFTADTYYDEGFGTPEVNMDLVIVLNDGSWLERYEYDGSECWEFKSTPVKPENLFDGKLLSAIFYRA